MIGSLDHAVSAPVEKSRKLAPAQNRRAQIGKSFGFEAAHRLPNHRGKCARPHGHSYRVEVMLEGRIDRTAGASGEGMVADFADVSEHWRPLHAQLDHQDLNQVLPPEYHPTTAENIAAFVFDELRGMGLPVRRVRLWETTTSWAEVAL